MSSGGWAHSCKRVNPPIKTAAFTSQNRGAERAGVLNVSPPGNFEHHMPGIAQWFAEHPAGDTRV
jgi:hypothetical protein